MILTLTAHSAATIEMPPYLRLDHGSATIGRMPGVDLLLPDPLSVVSSRHCRIDWQDGGYTLTDTSTNGTRLNGHRLVQPQRLADGDRIGAGGYDIAVALTASAGAHRATSRLDLESWNRGGPARATAAVAAATLAAAPASRAATLREPGRQPAQPAVAATLPPLAADADAATRLLHAAGIARRAVAADDAAVLTAAGSLLRQLTSGIMTMLATRGQARSEVGVETPATTSPLQRPVPAETALAQLLGAPAAAEATVATGLADLEGHQRAALKAMQGALQKTLARLSPKAIRDQAGPGAQPGDAALWQAYEQAFAGTATDASFIELFARELAVAYAQWAGAISPP